jgi:hypothetical protein
VFKREISREIPRKAMFFRISGYISGELPSKTMLFSDIKGYL